MSDNVEFDAPKQRDGEIVRDFADRINLLFREHYGKYSSTAGARRFKRNTKKTWLVEGVNKEIKSCARPDIIKDCDDIMWPDVVAALQDAEWLFHLRNPKPLPNPAPRKNQFSFSVNNNGYVTVYTDGACSNNGRRFAKAGVGVWFGPDHQLNVSQALCWGWPVTNNVAEVAAVIRAISIVRGTGMRRLIIYTDSRYLYNSLREWVKNWLCNGWKLSTGQPVEHQKLFRKYLRLTEDMSVKLVHVFKKKKFQGNVEADRLAKEGAKRYRYPPSSRKVQYHKRSAKD